MVAVRLDDVVLDEGAGGPAVDGEVAVSFGEEGAGVDDLSGGGLACTRRGGLCWLKDLLPPVFQPLPRTKLPLSPDHFTLNLPSGPLF